MNRFLLFLFTISTITLGCFSQSVEQRREDAKTQIESLLSKSGTGPYRDLDEVIDVDSAVGAPGVANGHISDPYGTLKHCYLFMATTEGEQGENQKHSIGVYKENQIMWTSGQLPGSEYYGYMTDEGFLAAKDLNHKGNVDIAVYFSDGTNPPSAYYLWIFSWDGKEGKCINQCGKNGWTNISSTGAFEIVDLDNNGINEIRSYSGDLKVKATYYWNGSLYVEEKRPSRSRH